MNVAQSSKNNTQPLKLISFHTAEMTHKSYRCQLQHTNTDTHARGINILRVSSQQSSVLAPCCVILRWAFLWLKPIDRFLKAAPRFIHFKCDWRSCSAVISGVTLTRKEDNMSFHSLSAASTPFKSLRIHHVCCMLIMHVVVHSRPLYNTCKLLL